MKIAQIAPIIERVPPKKYGGTERVIYTLTEELVKMGHQVSLFASGDSQTSASLVSVTPRSLKQTHKNAHNADPYANNAITALHYGLAYKLQDQFDIIHDHHNYLTLPTAQLSSTPVVLTMHGPFLEEVHELYTTLTNPNIVTISQKQAQMAPNGINHAGTIYHGLNMNHYPFSQKHDGYLLFVGRITLEKGVHFAIEVARKLGLSLIIAAKLEEGFEADVAYFKRCVKPYLTDKIRWIGETNEEERNKLMSKAMAFLHPVTWPEPFGLTLIESMACGTPVIAMDQGSIPEIIQNGKTGFVVQTVDEMVESVKKVDTISRWYCRQYALERFSGRRMAQQYVQLYSQILQNKKPTQIIPKSISGDLLGKVINQPYVTSKQIISYAHDIQRDLKFISSKPKLVLDLNE